MPRGGKNKGGNKKWSRKRKVEERSAKSDKPRNNGGGYYTIINSNAKFEAYYSLVGLHNNRYDEESKKFVSCANDAEKHAERDLFMTSMTSILPASFRVDRSLDATTQKNVLDELQEFVGKEMEVEIELPKRSQASGGMKNILDKGTDGEEKKVDGAMDENKDDAKKEEGDAKSVDATTKTGNETTTPIDNGPTIIKKTIAPAKPIPFISSGETVLGYQLSVDRRTLRRNKSLEPLHEWLKIQTDCGHVTRQETVSMIPPVVLDAKEGMSVLDMCAAPGSKTCQLVEHVGGFSTVTSEGGEKKNLEPKGYVVANDADEKRAYMLVHQLRRMNSPAIFVTSCDGQFFPILDEKSDKGTEREGTFDRVLADVPCSGDGTIRKNPGIWRHWNHLGSLALHPLQLSIALRGARLTKVGGYVVYSTCSMNPMENEAVVAELLRVSEGSLVLEDPRERMEGLIARPGWSSWRVLRESQNRTRKAMKDWKKKNNSKMMAKKKEFDEKREEADGHYGPAKKEAKVDDTSKDGDEKKKDEDQNKKVEKEEEEEVKFVPSPFDTKPYVPPSTWDEAALNERTTSLGFHEYKSYDEVEPEWRRRVRASCFPPTDEEAKKFELEKCLRCLPQDMDTGGFFVALLKKVKPLNMAAIERMNTLAKESRGGGEVDGQVPKKWKGKKGQKSESDKKGSENEDVGMTESSAVEDKTDGETTTTPEAKDDDKPKEENKKENEDEETIRKAPQGKVGAYHGHQKKEDLSKQDFAPADPSIWPPIMKEFGLDTSTFPADQFFVRASGEAKILYFLCKNVKGELIDRGIQERVTVINSGLKAFERCSLKESNHMSYRVAQEGIQYIVPHMTKRILSANMDDFCACIKLGFTPFDSFSEKLQEGLKELTPGSFIVTLEGYEKDVAKKMYLTMWRRTNNCVNCFVAKIEMEAMLSKMRALGYVPKKEDEEDKSVESVGKEPAVEEKMDTSS